ncbi:MULTISPECIES: hypothetical protein [Gordonia]|nr:MULTISPECIES: hypothetical protein [Gordonia]
MDTHAVTRWMAVAAGAALLAVGVASCDNGDRAVRQSVPSTVVTVTKSVAPVTDSGSPTVTVMPTESTETTEAATETSPRSDLSSYYGEWTGHGRQMTLQPDGTALVTLASGAANVEKWTAMWGAHGNGIVVTLDTMTWHTGEPLGNQPGTSWTAVLAPSAEDGVTVLHMPGFADWCSTRFGRSVVCGA